MTYEEAKKTLARTAELGSAAALASAANADLYEDWHEAARICLDELLYLKPLLDEVTGWGKNERA